MPLRRAWSRLVEYIEDLHFDEEDIAYLRGKGIFCEDFLEYLRTFRFTGDICAVPEGTPVFPKRADGHGARARPSRRSSSRPSRC